MRKPYGVILAGGKARRMGGGDKCRIKLGKVEIINHVLKRLNPQVETLAININGNTKRFLDLNIDLIEDNIPNFAGPLAGVLAGLDWAHSKGTDLIVTVAADTPFFPLDLVSRFLDAGSKMPLPIVFAATRNESGEKFIHPTFGLWPVAIRHDLRAGLLLGLRKIKAFADSYPNKEVVFETKGQQDPFFNINTPQDLELARRMML